LTIESASACSFQWKADGVIGSAQAPVSLGGLDYWVEANAVDGQVTALVATATDAHRQSRIELVVRNDSSEITDFGIFGKKLVDLKSNAKIDSYDSSLGTYASQVSGAYAHSNGNVGSNDQAPGAGLVHPEQAENPGTFVSGCQQHRIVLAVRRRRLSLVQSHMLT
jgi:hypothetical protein